MMTTTTNQKKNYIVIYRGGNGAGDLGLEVRLPLPGEVGLLEPLVVLLLARLLSLGQLRLEARNLLSVAVAQELDLLSRRR